MRHRSLFRVNLSKVSDEATEQVMEEMSDDGEEEDLADPVAQSHSSSSNAHDGTTSGSATGSSPAHKSALGKFILSDVDLQVEGPSLIAVCGAVGAGKSTLLESILGETNIFQGKPCVVRGSIAYVPQTAWILNDTVRENIVLGRPFDKDWCVVGWNHVRPFVWSMRVAGRSPRFK